METIIIDTNNLLHKISNLKILLDQDKDIAVDTMITKLQSHFLRNTIKIILVFDGYGKNRHIGNIEAKFAITNALDYENADNLIKYLIDRSRNPKLLKIISSDNEITWYAKNSGCRIQSVKSFWGELKEKRIQRKLREDSAEEKPKVITRVEFDYLLKEFTKKK